MELSRETTGEWTRADRIRWNCEALDFEEAAWWCQVGDDFRCNPGWIAPLNNLLARMGLRVEMADGRGHVTDMEVG